MSRSRSQKPIKAEKLQEGKQTPMQNIKRLSMNRAYTPTPQTYKNADIPMLGVNHSAFPV